MHRKKAHEASPLPVVPGVLVLASGLHDKVVIRCENPVEEKEGISWRIHDIKRCEGNSNSQPSPLIALGGNFRFGGIRSSYA
ncbi:hypothetical protein D3C75_1067890 [compost metagenome]